MTNAFSHTDVTSHLSQMSNTAISKSVFLNNFSYYMHFKVSFNCKLSILTQFIISLLPLPLFFCAITNNQKWHRMWHKKILVDFMLCSLRKAMRARKSLQGAATIVRPGNKGNNRRIHIFSVHMGNFRSIWYNKCNRMPGRIPDEYRRAAGKKVYRKGCCHVKRFC